MIIPLARAGLAVAVTLALCVSGTTPLLGRTPHGTDQRAAEQATEAPFDEPASQLLAGLDGWRESPDHVRLFAPGAHASQYRAFVSAEALETVLRRITATVSNSPPGAWAIESLGPLEAFGGDGAPAPYTLARLYTAAPARVARGPHPSPEGFDAWTLISPYPDASLTRLSPGTLLLILRVPPL